MKSYGDKPSRGTNPDNRRKRRSSSTRGNPAANEGRSGYGSESVRPYLRAQLRAKELIQGPQLQLDLAALQPRKR